MVFTLKGVPMETIRNKILIVNDEAAIQILYSDELSEEGYDVITSGGGSMLMDMILKECPDLVVMDIRIVQDNGLDLIRNLKDTHDNLPVILCTASPALKYEMKSIAADYYVSKKSDLRELKSTIQNAICGEDSTQSTKTQSRISERKSAPMKHMEIPWQGAEGLWYDKTDSR